MTIWGAHTPLWLKPSRLDDVTAICAARLSLSSRPFHAFASAWTSGGVAPFGANCEVRAVGQNGHPIWLFAGSNAGGELAAAIYSIVETCKLNNVEPFANITDVMHKIAAGWPNSRIDELMPWALSPVDDRKAA